ncbi:hypothetical protein HMPREF3086_01585 [Dietzia sp. HMSC21D01]|nr:hypothetical protein HMPREF3086_01585 [Dietzia sp. HMSC21D01]
MDAPEDSRDTGTSRLRGSLLRAAGTGSTSSSSPASPPPPPAPSPPATRLESPRTPTPPPTRIDAPSTPTSPPTRIESPGPSSSTPSTRLEGTLTRSGAAPTRSDSPPATRVESPSRLGGTLVGRATGAHLRENLPPGLAAKYTLISELGAGSEARVYLCEDSSGRHVAIKLYFHTPTFSFDPRDEKYRSRFTHEHAVELIDREVDHGVTYEVLEYCADGTLADLLAASPRSGDAGFADEVLTELADALECLQSSTDGPGLVHADVKPSNILVRTRAPLDLVFTDFGLTVDLGGRSRMTNTGAGTVAYAAPGSAYSHRAADDWWSLGMILYEIIVGHGYFQSPDGSTLGERAIEEHLYIQDIDLAAVTDSGIPESDRWILLLSGLLTRDYAKRWGADEVRRWRGGESPEVHRGAPPAPRVTGGTAEVRPARPLVLWGDLKVTTPHELGVAFAENPSAAARSVTGTAINSIQKWLWRDAGLDDALTDIREDWQAAETVAYLTARLAPEQTIRYLGYDISTTPALQNSFREAASATRRTVQDFRTRLYETRLLGALADPVYRPTYDSLDANWHDVTQLAYDEAEDRGIGLDAQARHAIRDNALHVFCGEGSRDSILSGIDDRIRSAEYAREVDWFDRLVTDLEERRR